jgi:spermidine/putrescine transport system substrate-binding protein
MKNHFKNLLTISLLVFTALSLTNESHAQTHKLNLFIWSEYIDPAVVADFEKQFDCKVNIDLYEDVESMLAKVQGGGAELYDLVVPTDHIVPAMIKLNLLAPLRHANIPNLTNLNERFISPAYDRGNKFTAAYQWGTLGILTRRESGKPVPDSWSVFFDAKQQAGSFLLMDSVRDTIGAALKYKASSVNSTETKDLKVVRDILIEAKKRSIGFDGSVGAKNKVLAKTAKAALVYSGEGVRAMIEDTNTVYVIPKEGSVMWVDSLCVLAKAPHRDLAEKFINFVLEPKNGARISAFTQFSTPNSAAKGFLKPEDLSNPAVYPPDDVMARLELLNDLGAKLRLYDEVWTQVKVK